MMDVAWHHSVGLAIREVWFASSVDIRAVRSAGAYIPR